MTMPVNPQDSALLTLLAASPIKKSLYSVAAHLPHALSKGSASGLEEEVEGIAKIRKRAYHHFLWFVLFPGWLHGLLS